MSDVCMMVPTRGAASENEGRRVESVADVFKKVNGITGDIMVMVNLMSGYLIGTENAEKIENEVPKCFKGDMDLHCRQLGMIANELARLMEGMGISQ